MDIRVEVKPTAVTVFPDRASVVCNGRCELQKGRHQLLLTHLPLALDPQSVRVTGQGTVQVRILSVDVKKEFFTDAPQKNIRDLEEEIEKLEDELRQIGDKKAGWEAHGRYLEGMRQATQAYAKGLSKGTSQISDQIEIINFLQEQDAALRTALYELDNESRALQKQIEKLRQELGLIGKGNGKKLYQAVVDVQALDEGRFEPQISFVVNQASWRPLYDIRLRTAEMAKPTIEVTTMAEIWQRSGQAWQNVALSVSTARPALNQRLPQLKPWFIDEARPLPRQKLMAHPRVAAAGQMDMARAKLETAVMSEPAAEVEAEVVSASVENSGTSINFRVPGGTDIPEDGSPYKTTLDHANLDGKIDYMAVPKHTDAVYRRATIINNTGSPWLAGQANLFVDDEYIGKTKLEYAVQGGELELLLGVEERITIGRELKRRDVDKKILRDSRRVRFGYEIELKNLMNEAVVVAVEDHIPVSRHDQIKVKPGKVEPQPKEVSDLNEMSWEVHIDPDHKEKIIYDFTVEHPRDLQIIGLP